MKKCLRSDTYRALLALAALCLPLAGGAAQAQQAVREIAPTPPQPIQDPTLYVIGYSHLDTQWCWSYPQVIREFIPNTLHQNFTLFEKYPDYVFNWTGSNRYRFMKEYYPEDYATLKRYIAAGRWYPNGSSVEEGDVDIPSEESIIRQVMYGNRFFRREFGVAGDDYTLPDCFGFPASLPSILAHCGVKGFTTQKLTWGSAVGIPFNIGLWEGPDGRSVMAALNAGAYDAGIADDLSHDAKWEQRVAEDVQKTGTPVDYRYYGVGDRGGSVRDADAARMEESLHGGGPLHIRSGRADQIFEDLSPTQIAGLPRYRGDLLLTQHSAGSATSEAAMKRWNRKNELLADDAERAAVAADWLGAQPYDRARLTDAWLRFLPGQFHDLMAGTALPVAYTYTWNDEVLALNESADVLQSSVGGVARALDTRARGVPVVVYNPLSIGRQDVVAATVTFPGATPPAVRVVGPDGHAVPSQVVGREGAALSVLFLATAPSVGYAAYDVRPAPAPAAAASPLRVTADSVENARYRVRLGGNGDVAGVYDKTARRELLSGPARLAYQYENPTQFPAWNMDWHDQSRPPRGYVGGPATVRIVERGPVRVALQVTRVDGGSRFVQTIRLAAGGAGDRVEFATRVDWQGKECALKAVFPLAVSNPEATYNWGLGTIERGNDDPKKYEVPSHEWFDVTDTDKRYGVSVLDDCKYGSDKPDNTTVRLTLLYTPGVRGGYQHQATQDWGRHEMLYALEGHPGDWRRGNSQWEAMRLNQPLLAFQTSAHPGNLGRTFSLARVSTRQVSVEALKKAEDGGEVIVRLNELSGKSAPNTRLSFAGPILSAREVDGQERPEGKATVQNGSLVVDMTAYRPRAFALRLAHARATFPVPQSHPLALPYNLDAVSSWAAKTDGDFDGSGRSLPGELLPATLVSDGVTFRLGPTADGRKNAVICRGQSLPLPAGTHRRVYLLAAAVGGDVPATFGLGGKSVALTVQRWDGKIGQWDTRLWQGQVPELTYDWHNPLGGLVPGYIKRAPVAWYADHRRLADGTNDIYQFCYLFRYALAVPDGVHTLTLPKNDRIRVLAATVAQNPNDDTRPAQPLYDMLDRGGVAGPAVSPAGGAFHDATAVSVRPPLYWNGDDTLRYTLDGSAPGPQSPVYTGPVLLTRSATLRVAQFGGAGRPGAVTTARFDVRDTTPPAVRSATASPLSPYMHIAFSEPLDRATAEDAARYALQPPIAVRSATLDADGRGVTLTLATPVTSTSTLTVSGIRDLSPAGNATAARAYPVALLRPVYDGGGAETLTGTGRGIFHRDVPDLPTGATAPWTINMFVFTNQRPDELSILGGFGDARDEAGTQRYVINYHGGIHFWGSGVDISSGIPLDLGRWQMVTATFDGQTVRLYKDGQEIKSGDAAFSEAAPEVRLGPAGPWENGHRFTGRIAGLTIWDHALTAGDVQALRTTAPAP